MMTDVQIMRDALGEGWRLPHAAYFIARDGGKYAVSEGTGGGRVVRRMNTLREARTFIVGQLLDMLPHDL